MSEKERSRHLTHASGTPVADNVNIITAGPRGPALLQDVWLIEKMAHFDREVIPERRMHAKGAGAFGTFTVTHDITRYSKAKIFSEIGKTTPMFARFRRQYPTEAVGAASSRPFLSQTSFRGCCIRRLAARSGASGTTDSAPCQAVCRRSHVRYRICNRPAAAVPHLAANDP